MYCRDCPPSGCIIDPWKNEAFSELKNTIIPVNSSIVPNLPKAVLFFK